MVAETARWYTARSGREWENFIVIAWVAFTAALGQGFKTILAQGVQVETIKFTHKILLIKTQNIHSYWDFFSEFTICKFSNLAKAHIGKMFRYAV